MSNRRRPRGSGPLLIGLLLAAFAAAGCVDEKVVFRDRPLFEEPATGAAGFLGYDNAQAKLTVCGNCHSGKQAGWEQTAHADAWAGLQSSGHAQAVCESCHTVNEYGNTTEEDGGWVATGDPRYQDVQCESCHGPGLNHVQNPDATQPLANVLVGVDLTTGCGECHSDAHHPFVEQWEQSAHGQVPNQSSPLAVGPFCLPCHEGKSALTNRMGETSNYVEKGGDPMPITCAVCHDPHPEGTPFTAQLRAPIEVATTDHLCVRCHSNRGTPPSSHGPHGAQGLLVLGQNVGWIPPGFEGSDRIVSTHGSEANPQLCATCHVSSFEVTDQETGEFAFQSVGHTFNAIPCLNEEGIPTGETDCQLSARTFEACAASGCHGSASAARGAFVAVRSRLERLLDELWYDTDGDHVMDATDEGLLPGVVAQGDTSELDVTDQNVSVAEGALWNAQLAYTHTRPWFADAEVFGIHFGTHKASGEGVHNPFLLEALLIGSIRAVENEYNLQSDPRVNLDRELTPPPGVAGQ